MLKFLQYPFPIYLQYTICLISLSNSINQVLNSSYQFPIRINQKWVCPTYKYFLYFLTQNFIQKLQYNKSKSREPFFHCQMDLYDFNSSDEKQSEIEIQNDYHSSSGGCKTAAENLSTTDNDRNQIKKSKIIKKNYQPIRDGNLYIRYEDDPAEYKRLRKKIQNRESAARVRGRKKGTMENLQVQCQQLKKVNSQLMLRNATLETENRSLKNQIEFLRGLVKPRQSASDPIDKYLNLSPSISVSGNPSPCPSPAPGPSSSQMQGQFQSPFDSEQLESPLSFNWIRSTSSAGGRSNWSTLFVLTILVCIFVLPNDGGVETGGTAIVAQQVENGMHVVQGQAGLGQLGWMDQFVDAAWKWGKIAAKYGVLIGYLVFLGGFIYGKYVKRKLKNV